MLFFGQKWHFHHFFLAKVILNDSCTLNLKTKLALKPMIKVVSIFKQSKISVFAEKCIITGFYIIAVNYLQSIAEKPWGRLILYVLLQLISKTELVSKSVILHFLHFSIF